jgi:hypothetical protein
MKRRTLIKAAITATLAGGWGMPKAWACACGGTTQYLPASTLGPILDEPIEALFDRDYGAGQWQFNTDMDLEVKHPDIAENTQVIPVTVNLLTLPDGMARCAAVAIYRRNKVTLVTTRNSNDYRQSTVNYRLTRCFPANILPMIYGTRYRGAHGTATLFVAASFVTTTGGTRVLVYQPPHAVRSAGCGSTVFVEYDTE